jgi:hypothetical protein
MSELRLLEQRLRMLEEQLNNAESTGKSEIVNALKRLIHIARWKIEQHLNNNNNNME